jgi:multiple sugar transport system substrate-binding protein
MKRFTYIAAALAVVALAFSTAVYARSIPASSTHRAAAVSAVTGCKASGTITYKFWGDKGEDIEQTAAIEQAEDDCPHLHVIANWDQGNYDGDLATEVGSGNAPDVFQLDAGKRVPEFVTLDHALTNLSPYAKTDKFNALKTYFKGCAQQAMYGGKLYGLPRDCGNNQMLIFNKDIFRARHVAFPTNTWTLNNFLAAAKKLTGVYSLPHDSTARARWAIPIQQDEYRVNGYMYPFGGNWLTAPKNGHQSCNLTSAGSRAGLTWWSNLIFKYHVAPTTAQQGAAGGDFSGFQNERFAMYYVGPWALNYLVKPSPYTGNKPVPWGWGVALTPKDPNHASHNGMGVVDPAIEAVYSGSKHKYAAWEFVKYLTTSKPAALEAAYGIGIPGDLATAKSKYVSNEYKPYTKTWVAGNTTGQPMRTIPQHEKWVNQAFSPAMSHLFDGSWSVNQATTYACTTGSAFMP